MDDIAAQRIDKWLWAARFFKTRTLAADAVTAGKVRVGDERVKTARLLKGGEVLRIDNGTTVWQVVVLAPVDNRGSAEQALRLYLESAESVAAREQAAQDHRYFREPGSLQKGRPTKRDRRLRDKSAGD